MEKPKDIFSENDYKYAEMDQFIKEKIHQASNILIYLIVTVVLFAALVDFLGIPHIFIEELKGGDFSLLEFIKRMMNIMIAVEVVHVLCYHSIDSFVDVLLMAVTRELLIEQHSSVEMLIGIVSVSLLFIVRKYLFIPDKDNKKSHLEMIEELNIKKE